LVNVLLNDGLPFISKKEKLFINSVIFSLMANYIGVPDTIKIVTTYGINFVVIYFAINNNSYILKYFGSDLAIDKDLLRNIIITYMNSLHNYLLDNRISLVHTGHPSKPIINTNIFPFQFLNFITLYPTKICDSIGINFITQIESDPSFSKLESNTWINDTNDFYKPFSKRCHTTYEKAAIINGLTKDDIVLIESCRPKLFDIKINILTYLKRYLEGSSTFLEMWTACIDTASVLSDVEFEFFYNGYDDIFRSFYKGIFGKASFTFWMINNKAKNKIGTDNEYTFDFESISDAADLMALSGSIGEYYGLVQSAEFISSSKTSQFFFDKILPIINKKVERTDLFSSEMLKEQYKIWLMFKEICQNDIEKYSSTESLFRNWINMRLRNTQNNNLELSVIKKIKDTINEKKGDISALFEQHRDYFENILKQQMINLNANAHMIPKNDYIIKRGIGVWQVTFESDSFTVKDNIAMKYVVNLIDHEGQYISAEDLHFMIPVKNAYANYTDISKEQIDDIKPPPIGVNSKKDTEPKTVITFEARDQYLKRMAELNDLIGGEVQGSEKEKEYLIEYDDIEAELRKKTDKDGNPRKESETEDYYYNSIKEAYRRLLISLSKNNSASKFKTHLDNSIKKEPCVFCYNPQPKVDWQIEK